MIKDLKGLRCPEKLEAKPLCDFKFEATPLPQLDFPTEAAKLLKIVSLGEHATLVAGPAGSGKTTLARGLHALLGPPPSHLWPEMARVKRWFSDSTPYRPFVSPHHSVTPSSMIGGDSGLSR
ncbi:MAG: ATP-binding protein [Bdellovibrionales bacterium]|nr:ATP-binding protein [Bdellovibrionales bacterium]